MWGFLLSLLCLTDVNAQLLPNITNIVPLWIGVARPAVTPLDPTASLHTLRYVTWAWFEVWATCNNTAVGPLFLGSLRRTNQAVNCTLANKNTAYAYASYRVMSIPFYAESQASFDATMLSWGLNPADTSNDTSTPVGLGNKIGYAIREFMGKDGMNSLGDLNTDTDQGTFYGIPYADYTHYEPSQTTYNLLNPDRWQPQVESRANGNGFFGRGAKTYGNSGIQSVQTYASPQTRFAAAFGFTDSKVFTRNFSIVYAKYGGGAARRQAYRKQAADIIAFSANLTDQRKIEAEFFESKNLAFGTPMPFLAANTRGSISGQKPWTVDDWVVWEFVVNAAVWDSVVVAWSTKRKRDVVRPITAVRFLYQDDLIYSWGGPGKGNVYQRGAAFKPWLKTMAHSEYPSGSSCMCASFAEANRQFFNGNDSFANFAFPVTAGSSGVEPGFVPAVNMTVGPFATFTQYAQTCGQSRAYAGVHFQQSIVDALEVCKHVGANAALRWREYLAGTVTTPADPNNRRIYTQPEFSVGTDVELDD